MRKILIAIVTDGTDPEFDLDTDATLGEYGLSDSEVVIMIATQATPTGIVTLQGDKVGTEDDARVYATLTDEDTAADVKSVTGVDAVQLFNVKLPRFLKVLSTVSAGSLNIYALIS